MSTLLKNSFIALYRAAPSGTRLARPCHHMLFSKEIFSRTSPHHSKCKYVFWKTFGIHFETFCILSIETSKLAKNMFFGPRHTPNPLSLTPHTLSPKKGLFLEGGSVPPNIFSILEIWTWFKIFKEKGKQLRFWKNSAKNDVGIFRQNLMFEQKLFFSKGSRKFSVDFANVQDVKKVRF